MLKKLISGMVLCGSLTLAGVFNVQANDTQLMQAVKDNGLIPIPKNAEEVRKLTETTADAKKNPYTKAKAELGKKLYFDPRLSRSNLISCNTCHNLALGGVDLVPAAIGHKWTANPSHLNSPTVYNSVLNTVQFWDGRSPHLSDQARGPMQAGPEMAAYPALVEARINSIPEYVQEFQAAYGKNTKITFDLIADTIGVFERDLVTPSRFDDFLNGDTKAMSQAEKDGLKVFMDKGCTSCHTGIGLGGTMQTFAQAKPYKFASLGNFKGDANGMIKTPTLRNITLTAPYFHNGAFWDIKEAIKEMGSVQLGITISNKEAEQIATFFKSLEGRMPTITYPILPASTLKTPEPTFD